MPSTRKQKAKEKRSRQSDVLSDIKNLDVMLGNYANSDIRDQDTVDQIEIDPESSRRQQSFSQEESNYRSLLNTNLSENSEITVETSRAISSEISSQMSRKLCAAFNGWLVLGWSYTQLLKAAERQAS